MTPPAMGLLGSGEFEPWSQAVDLALLERAGGDGRVLILPTASAAEGDGVYDAWAAKGLEHFAAVGADAEVVALKSREDADRADLVDRLEGASLVYFSGGNPWYLAEALRGSAFCARMVERMSDGLAYAGCSAGVACLAETTFDSATDNFEEVLKPGLGIVRGIVFGPHWDMVDTWIPGAAEFIVDSVPEGSAFIGLDEHAAMVGDGTTWEVFGTGKVHVRVQEEWVLHAAGETFDLAFDLSEGA